MTATQDRPGTGGVEVRSIDYVPLNERHGRLLAPRTALVRVQRAERASVVGFAGRTYSSAGEGKR